jgi:hypothetical protein
MTNFALDKAIRSEGKLKAHIDQKQAIRVHGEDTIIGMKRGLVAPENSVEEQVLLRGYSPPDHREEHYKPPTGQSRFTGSSRSDSWGSVPSDAAHEMQRIHELGQRARAVGMKGAAVHQAAAMKVHSVDTLLGLEKGLIKPSNPTEVLQRPLRTGSSRASQSNISFGSVCSDPRDEIERIHAIAGEARKVGRKLAGAHQLEPIRQQDEDAILHDLHHPKHSK